MVRFLTRYFDEQYWRIGGGEPIETEEQFSCRMGWPETPEDEWAVTPNEPMLVHPNTYRELMEFFEKEFPPPEKPITARWVPEPRNRAERRAKNRRRK